ncbi:2-oxo-4-hydroxy-4-carboxy-5-ureidoimidazoline decarboxylase [Xylophilus sp. ASV27]|uniref:2-oxo-4-hydroxy-4-carboxy-5-ureidoimidazoline decarboxylase n=1 Tax=Xylophilus sp. ASV27 TaxID=2795129 RepID=UPI0018EA3323|nr:2-oxo-4-hydroxy-4-carboxy-5-ureidoimidazoline decarboxylase [Xylophilus sp. ASV27]
MTLTLDQLNAATPAEAARLLDGLYEHSPWIVEQTVASAAPFASLAHLKHALARTVAAAPAEAQLGLIRAHPELAGKAMVARTLTAESAHEQSKAGLTHCTPEEFARIQQLNADYNARFGFPFILAVRGPRGTGLGKQQIIETFARRLQNHPDFERAEALRNIHRIAEIRLGDKFGVAPLLGDRVWDWHESLAQYSDPGFAEQGQLTVTYLTAAHQACARHIAQQMRDCGFDEVGIDAVGNVVGRYHGSDLSARALLTGSHYDTVRNGGRYDGRLGIYVPMACVQELHRQGRRLPFAIEVVGFAEEEGQRYKATFLGSGALIGDFKPAWLDQLDAEGISMRDAMRAAGLPATLEAIAALRRDPARYLGFVEVHIEQGPVLNELDLPLGIVTSINGSVRYVCEVIGTASHAGTTPMARRRDAAAAVAELALYLEQRAARDGDSVGTIGILQVPNGSINVVPGRCRFTLDMRAPNDPQRDALEADVRAALAEICARRGVHHTLEQTERAAAAPSAPAWQQRWEQAVAALGLPLYRMPSGAGHDAMKLHQRMPQAMLFVRGENSGISHNPLESSTSADMDLAVHAFQNLLAQLAADTPT